MELELNHHTNVQFVSKSDFGHPIGLFFSQKLPAKAFSSLTIHHRVWSVAHLGAVHPRRQKRRMPHRRLHMAPLHSALESRRLLAQAVHGNEAAH